MYVAQDVFMCTIIVGPFSFFIITDVNWKSNFICAKLTTKPMQ